MTGLVALGVVGASACPMPAHAETAEADRGRAFEPRPASEAQYDVSAPTDTNGQRFMVPVIDDDGTTTELSVEVWLPVATDSGPAVPERVPTVVEFDTYYPMGEPHVYSTAAIEHFVRRGYAFAMSRVRGRFASGGCHQLRGPIDASDSGAVVTWLADEAPWSDGNVATWGISYSGGTAITAATRGAPDKVKAVIAMTPYSSVYDYVFQDGVRFAASPTYYDSMYPSPMDEFVSRPDERIGCYPEHVTATVEPTASVTPYFQERDDRVAIDRLTAATLIAHGIAEFNVLGDVESGLFDRIPESTPKAGLFGVYPHVMPDDGTDLGGVPMRADWWDMQIAWLDRYLKDLDTGVESWPTVQVQGNDGQWRAERDWPITDGPLAQLALGSGGTLGTVEPTGSTTYVEAGAEVRIDGGTVLAPQTFATFTTPALLDRLEITGESVLDLWVTLDRPDAHVAVRLETLGPDGELLGERGHGHLSELYDTAGTIGFRSAQHIQPLVNGRFWQDHAVLPPVGEPVHVMVRLQPHDLVVPAGGRVRIVIAGSLISRNGVDGDADLDSVVEDPSEPSGLGTIVTVLHDRDHPSALRFHLPSPRPDLLDVREWDELDERIGQQPKSVTIVSDGGGIATAPVWGSEPAWPEL